MTCDSPFYVLPKKWASEKVPVPCGKCPPCKLRRVNSWVFRLLQEEKVSQSAHFVTLTYDTRAVPITENGFMSLRKRDYQLFMKRLRKLCPTARLKYYAVGEYGTQNQRPHYHAILFNAPSTDLLAEAWQMGQIHIGQVSGDSIAYTMKYIDKPSTARRHARDDREREFSLMSKGLGAAYLSKDMIAYHRADLTRLYATKEGGHRIALPRYYRQKIYTEANLKWQVEHIQAVVQQQEDAERRKHYRAYPSGEFTFEAKKGLERYHRYQSFYSKLKSRNV